MNGSKHQTFVLWVKTIINKEIFSHLVQGLILGIEFVLLSIDEAI